ncbi:MAG: YaiI/YqxD family protein [Bacillota bacterium]|nr:YaiI/YqxD family protein [Bacillota bacterium]
MRILVDADSCPVKNIILKIAKKYNIPVIMFCDTSHILNDGYSMIVTVDKGADSVDIALANKITSSDIAVTQDYGVAALVLGKGAKALNQNGMVYCRENIDLLLFERHLSKKVRRGGGRLKSIPPRAHEDDLAFENALLKLIVD